MRPGDYLEPGEWINSNDFSLQLRLNTDGNAVIYRANPGDFYNSDSAAGNLFLDPVCASDTYGQVVSRFSFLADSTLCALGSDQVHCRWNSVHGWDRGYRTGSLPFMLAFIDSSVLLINGGDLTAGTAQRVCANG